MYFPNGQSYNVILVKGSEKTLIHEPWPILPRKDERFHYRNKHYIVEDVVYDYGNKNKRRKFKPQVQIICRACCDVALDAGSGND